MDNKKRLTAKITTKYGTFFHVYIDDIFILRGILHIFTPTENDDNSFHDVLVCEDGFYTRIDFYEK